MTTVLLTGTATSVVDGVTYELPVSPQAE